MTPQLRVRLMRYRNEDLDAWKRRPGSLIKRCPTQVKTQLRAKAKARPGRRFFGEAFVLADSKCRDGWYGSFKWLTSRKWSGDGKLPEGYQERFRRALNAHFPGLAAFQTQATVVTRKRETARPVGPDLWLITPRAHRFIEVKLPNDTLRDTQLAGLALIGALLKADRRVRVEVALLYSGKKPLDEMRSLKRDFKQIVGTLGL